MDKTKFSPYGTATKFYGDPTRFYGWPLEFDYKIELWNGTTLSEILNKMMIGCSWGIDRIGGCSQAMVTVKGEWTDFLTITPAWKIRIKVRFEAGSDYENVFVGNVVSKIRTIDNIENIRFMAVGYQNQLQKVVVYRHPLTDEPASYSSVSINGVLTDLLDDYILPYTDILYNAGDIGDSSIIPENILFDSAGINAIQLLATLAGNYEWGINGDGYFYFKEKSAIRKWDFYSEDNISFAELESDGSDLTNRIYFTGNYGLEEILEDENDVDSTSQLTNDTSYSFGKITTYNELMQTFTGLSRLKDLTLKIKKVGVSNIIIDGNMEMPGVTNWSCYGYYGSIQKLTDTPFEGLQYLAVNPPGSVSGVYQAVTLIGGATYNLSVVYRKKSTSKVIIQIYNWSNGDELSYYENNPKSWTTYQKQFTVSGTGAQEVHIRFRGAKFDIDKVELYSDTADDIDVWLVATSDPSTALKSFIIENTLIGDSETTVKMGITYDGLIPATEYGIRIKRQGALSNASYYNIFGSTASGYANGILKYSSDAGETWSNHAGDAYFKMEYSLSQATYDVRSERIKNNSISSIEDARLWVNSYLSSKNYPRKRGLLKLTSRTHRFERDIPIDLVSIRSSSGTQDDYQIDNISYEIGENGLNVSLELGTVNPKISDYLGWLNYQIEQLR